ncbi:MAG: hypothetical protein KDA81_16085, partial [Planctomycetaceae bacterium]|nr:hypothetical protein [Planctomycetaceae bacterium]
MNSNSLHALPRGFLILIVGGLFGIPGSAIAQSSDNLPVGRVSDGLLVLYDFSEGSGPLVRNQSQFTRMDLTAAEESRLRWRRGRLSLTAGTSLVAESNAAFVEAIQKAGE